MPASEVIGSRRDGVRRKQVLAATAITSQGRVHLLTPTGVLVVLESVDSLFDYATSTNRINANLDHNALNVPNFGEIGVFLRSAC